MKIPALSLGLLSTLVLGSVVEASPAHHDVQSLASRQINQWQKQYEWNIAASIHNRKSGCTPDKIMRRQEWGSMSRQARKDYIKAVRCLQKKPPRSSLTHVPGARSRFDDFAATHIIHTPNVHFSGLFFHFHRHFLHLYEKALRDECGYKGAQPYWDWTINWKDPRQSPVFDGSSTSMGGNGKFVPHNATTISAFGLTLDIAPATGGGCVETGPFKDYQLHLGPIAFEPRGPNGGLGYNPRCLSRDLSPVWSNLTKPTDVVRLINSCTDLECFDTNLEALDGVHAGGHFAIGGMGLDAYASAGDPAFYLHHAQVDRVWNLWQNLNAKNRTNQLFGTNTAFNKPPSDPVTPETEIDFGVLGDKQKAGSLGSTVDGPFCYVYV